jgi:predicted HTH domain antitoxin
MTVDPKVYDLAQLFISDHRSEIVGVDEARALELAELIQITIEDFISEIKERNDDLKKHYGK